MSKLTKTARTCFDIFIFLAACFMLFAILKWFQPFRRGFFCHDESLQYPFLQSTIGSSVVLLISLGVPCLVILTVELFKRLNNTACKRKPNAGTGCRIGYRLLQCYKHVGIFLFGFALTITATMITKHSTGRLRPHFFAVCQPELPDGTNCSNTTNFGRYITDYTCKNSNATAHMISEATVSFPSGHASLMFYAMLYVSIYLQSTLSTRASKLLKHLLQFIFIMLAWYVSLTRVADYHHHWSDVLAGASLGALLAVLVAVFVAEFFNCVRPNQRPQIRPSTSTTSSAKSATPVLPAYTFGSIPYLHHPHQYGQTYHNYGYVP
ncbi:putative phosphatidate phosphatase [Teleopsis dalmanni]|uniref:putative phosphatidate phosphatase n=1 Tax=Teleopsis dalmanni TaxID=139649 RepID=UPI0018CCEDC1|nr:putative phosphatidate phosphatase [Teleopsis dalmanni]XP_037934182.1 putative phosphatidate phosphatase [Teleopsis dalmanni]